MMPQVKNTHGIIHHDDSPRRTDYLYRLSLKCVVRNERDEVLVVKEAGRSGWDLPGGGMDHGEDIRASIAREMKEEVNLEGEFSYQIIAVEEPKHLDGYDFWQIRLIFAVVPQNMIFSAGDDSDEVAFKNPQLLKGSKIRSEQRVCTYASLR